MAKLILRILIKGLSWLGHRLSLTWLVPKDADAISSILYIAALLSEGAPRTAQGGVTPKEAEQGPR